MHAEVAEPILGDVNSSGTVNSDDAIHLLRYVLFGDLYAVNGATDFDGNGVTDSDDAIYLLRYVLFGDLYPLAHPAAFLNSERLANVNRYLYRVGNANDVKLGTLFRAINAEPDPSKVSVTVMAVAPSDTTTSGVYTGNASDWAQGTLRFSGEGPVKVTIAETGRAYDLYLEVINGNTVTFRLKNVTKLVVVCTGNIDGSMQIKLKDNVIYCCDSTADNNRNTVSLRFASYTYTGENGVEVAYTSVRTFTGATDGATIGPYRDLTSLEGDINN